MRGTPGADAMVPWTAACRFDLRHPERDGVPALATADATAADECAAPYAELAARRLAAATRGLR